MACSPLPGHKVGCAGIKDAIGDEAEDDDGETIHQDCGKVSRICEARRGGLTPITNTTGLFCASIEHGSDDHETGGDGAFADTEEKANGKEGTKGGAGSMAAEDDCPQEDVDAWRAVSGAGMGRMRGTSSICQRESVGGRDFEGIER